MTRTAREFTGFGPDLVDFYEGLSADNSKAYWQEHKGVYDQQVGGPARALAAALSEEFGAVKVFRPNRDVRFSADKSPYKTNVSMAREGGGAGTLYFAVAVDAVDLAGGMYMPSREQLARFRALQDDPQASASMDAVLADLGAQGFSMLEEGALKTAPRGWDAHHPRIDRLRLKHMAVGQGREPGAWLQGADCREQVATAWRAVEAWNAWLGEHVGIPADAGGERARPGR